MRVLKGHGTGNDFVILPDLDASVDLSVPLVRALCDRHRGIGADGVLRVVRTSAAAEAADQAGAAEFFMDYRNADGSIAEMCGNGVRVFARYLVSAGLVGTDAAGAVSFAVATRGGPREVSFDGDLITVQMGAAHWLDVNPVVTVASHGYGRPSKALEIPNPHVVVELDSLAELEDLDLSRAPQVAPQLPYGQNVEFVVRRTATHIAMRVHERGVGETLSCGTGICAAVVATAGEDVLVPPQGVSWRVDVPGGTCWVRLSPGSQVSLTGPAVLVGEIDLSASWLEQTLRG